VIAEFFSAYLCIVSALKLAPKAAMVPAVSKLLADLSAQKLAGLLFDKDKTGTLTEVPLRESKCQNDLLRS
jgi:hypothetical protein